MILKQSLRAFFLIGAYWVLTAVALHAQQAASSTIQTEALTAEDTLPLLIILPLSPERAAVKTDTLPDLNFRMYDPARRSPVDWGTLGNLGSSARPLFFDTPLRRGFSLGIRPFSLYQLQAEDLRFMRHKRTYSEAWFTRGQTQDEASAGIYFSRTFSDGINFSLDYRTVNNLGQLRNQRTRHGALAAGLWSQTSKRYQFFLVFSNNTNRQRDNGGIKAGEALSGDQFSDPISLDIRLPGELAVTKQTDWRFLYSHFLTFGQPQKRAFRASHQISYGRESFKFSNALDADDSNYADETAFFGPFVTDTRGLRHYTAVKKFENFFAVSTFKPKRNGQPSDVFSAGIRYNWYGLEQEPLTLEGVHNLFLSGTAAFTPSDRFGVEIKGDLGLLKNTGEYQLDGKILLGLGRLGELRAALVSQRRPPELIWNRLYISQRLVWQNEWIKPVENTLSATYSLPRWGFSATGRVHQINNYLYFDQTAQAAQTTAPVQVAQLLAQQNFRLWRIHLDNSIAWQQTSRTDVIHLPQWFSKNSLYYEGKIFKRRMLFNAGVDFRINGEFQPDAYQPATGQFHLQDTLTQQPYPWLDAFVALKIQSFRFFLRFDNLVSFSNPENMLFYSAWQPQPFPAFRVGINWRFFDGNRATAPTTTPSTANPPNGNAPPRGTGF